MSNKYSPPPKLKCLDCKLYSNLVSYNHKHKINLCADCFIDREINNITQNNEINKIKKE